MCISQSTLDSIETSQDDEAKIDLTRLEDWVWQDYDRDNTNFELNKCFINWVRNRIWIQDQSLSMHTSSQSEEWTMQWVSTSYEQRWTEASWHEAKELSNHWQRFI